jgi:hypothetical protein
MMCLPVKDGHTYREDGNKWIEDDDLRVCQLRRHRSDLQFIMGRLARMPTRGDLAKTALGIIFCTAVFTTLFCWIVGISRPITGESLIIALAVALACPVPLSAKEYRSRDVTREFQREHPCPSTGKTAQTPPYRNCNTAL